MALDISSFLLGKSKGGGGGSTTLITKNITENGTYTAKNDNADGYSKVNVNVEAPSVNLQNKEVTITQNGETTITADTGYDGLGEVEITTNVSGGADLSDYFEATIGQGNNSVAGYMYMIKKIPSTTTVNGTSLYYGFYKYQGTTIPLLDTSNVTDMNYMFYLSSNLTSIPLLNTSNVTSMANMFNGCTSLTAIPLLNTSNLAAMGIQSMFSGCTALTTVPILDTSTVTNMSNMFKDCPNLTDTSLDNILQMCINSGITNTARKNLTHLGLTSTNYPASRIQALPHYQDFIEAGWSIGY